MTRAPRLKRAYSIIGHSRDVVELRTGVWNPRSVTLTDSSGAGKLLGLLLGLDGTVSRADLAKREGVTRTEVEALIDHLDSIGALEEGPISVLDTYLDQVGALAPAEPVPPVPVVVLGDSLLADEVATLLDGITPAGTVRAGAGDPAWRLLCSLDSQAFADGLDREELIAEFAGWASRFVIFAEESINPVRFHSLNRIAVHLRFPWLHAAIDGPFLLIGPTVVPGRTACYRCFETRVAMNMRETASYQRFKEAILAGGVYDGERPVLRPLRAVLAGHVALEAVNYLHTGSTFTVDKVLGAYLPTMEIAFNEVLRLPGCADCGTVAGRDDDELYFDVRSWLDG